MAGNEPILAIKAFLDQGADFIVCTGGMSVDPDDVTPTAIKESGAQIITYGAPVLPGCVMYAATTIFDLLLPRIMTGEKLSKKDIVKLGHGGLCLKCKVCTYPNCSFGKA